MTVLTQNTQRPFRVLGLTGGIGTGKTTVAQIFETHGVPYVDADQLARQLREPGQLGAIGIQKRFGTTDRLKLRELLSTDPEAKKDLENILHPLIQIESEKALKRTRDHHPEAPFLLYEASLIIEAGRVKDFDGLIVVTAPLSDRIERIMARDQCSAEAALKMIQAQMSDEERLRHATHTLENQGSIHDLSHRVKNLLDQIHPA